MLCVSDKSLSSTSIAYNSEWILTLQLRNLNLRLDFPKHACFKCFAKVSKPINRQNIPTAIGPATAKDFKPQSVWWMGWQCYILSICVDHGPWTNFNHVTPVAISKLLEMIGRSAYILARRIAAAPNSDINQSAGSGGPLRSPRVCEKIDECVCYFACRPTETRRSIGQFSCCMSDTVGDRGL